MVLTALRILAVVALATVADAANEVKLLSYTYAGGRLQGTLDVVNLTFNKQLTVLYANAAGTWGNTCAATYTNGGLSQKSTWNFNCPISSAGVSKFFIEYKLSNGAVYQDNNGGKNYQAK